MGGNNYYNNNNNNRQQMKKSSSFSIFNLFKSNNRSSRVEDSWDQDSMKAYKVWPSAEDRGRYVAEPGIDKKASVYIAKIRGQHQAATPASN